MRLPLLPLRPVEVLRRVVQNLDVESQVHSRRNALIASTALARHRAELNEVADFLAARSARANDEARGVEHVSDIHDSRSALVSNRG